MPQVSGNLALAPIHECGTPEQQDAYMHRALPPQPGEDRQTCRGAFALTEPERRSDASSITTSAVPDGDDYVINGQKTMISGADIADLSGSDEEQLTQLAGTSLGSITQPRLLSRRDIVELIRNTEASKGDVIFVGADFARITPAMHALSPGDIIRV
jgi:hypothetical protein